MTQQAFLEPVATGSFDIVIRGYEQSQVHDRLDSLGRELSVLQADRDASLARAEKLARDLAAAHAETESLRASAQVAGAPSFQSMGGRISNMLRLAEDEAADIRGVAQEEQRLARTQLEAAAQECARLRTEAQDEAQRVLAEAHDQARRLVEQAQGDGQRECERMIAEAQQRVAELEAQAAEAQGWLDRLRKALDPVPTREVRATTDLGSRGDHHASESDQARHDLSVLGREDILEYRHTRRRVR